MSEHHRESVPRILLFGPAGAGKSSLLGALAQVSQTQGERLGAEIVDPALSLEPLLTSLRTFSKTEPTSHEVVTHQLRLRPWHAGAKEPGEPGPVTIVDCSGSAAADILKAPGTSDQEKAHPSLSSELRAADAIVLALSATADEGEQFRSFEEFRNFLESLNLQREWVRSIGGLPIAIVLTQCDRLARAGDTFERWQARVEDRKRRLAEGFAEYVRKEHARGANLPFGSLDVQIFASAIRRPVLTDAKDDEPFGVAELFRQSLKAAAQHRERAERSQHRLIWIVRGIGGLLITVLAAVAVLLFQQPNEAVQRLEDQIRSFQHQEGDATVRLASRNLTHNRQALEFFQNEPVFADISRDLRDFVDVRLRELLDYQAFRAKLLDGPPPADARSLENLREIEQRVASSLLMTVDTWSDTEAVRLRDKWLADVPAIRSAVRDWENWYRDLIREAGALEQTATFEGDWRSRVDRFLKRGGELPHSLGDTIPGSSAVPFPRGESILFASPYEFDRVYQARLDWEATRDRLLDLRDFADVLGLTNGSNKPAILDLPEDASQNLAEIRLRELSEKYPISDAAYPQWSLARFPEPGRNVLSQRLTRSLDRGSAQVRTIILAALGSPAKAYDNPTGWGEMAVRLQSPVFQSWGQLLTLLSRLRNPNASNPVEDLAAFLRTRVFELRLGSFEVTVPDDLRFPRAVPIGDLRITHKTRDGEGRVSRFRSAGGGVHSRGETTYTFTPEEAQVLPYHPGDGLSASLTLRAGEEELNLTWSESRCETYAFDALNRPVRGVRLVAGKGTAIPVVPYLLPNVRDTR